MAPLIMSGTLVQTSLSLSLLLQMRSNLLDQKTYSNEHVWCKGPRVLMCFTLGSLRWSAPPGRWRWRWSRRDPPPSGHIAQLSPAERNTGGRGRREQSPGPRPLQTVQQGEEPGPCGHVTTADPTVSVSSPFQFITMSGCMMSSC